MTLLSQPGVCDFRKPLFANNFQFLSGLNQVFQKILFVLYCIWLSGLYCTGSQVGFYMGRPDLRVSCRLWLILRQTQNWRSPPVAWLSHSANPLSELPVQEGGFDRMKHSLVTFINPLIPHPPNITPKSRTVALTIFPTQPNQHLSLLFNSPYHTPSSQNPLRFA